MTRLRTFSGIALLLHAEADAFVKGHLLAALVMVVLGALLAALAPLALKEMIDGLSPATGTGSSAGSLPASALLLGGAYLLALSCTRLLAEVRPWVFGRAEQRLYARLSRRFLRHLLDLRLEFHLDRRTGALAQTLVQANIGCQFILANLVNSIVPAVVEVVAIAAILVNLGQPALVATFVATSAAYIAVYFCSAIRLVPTACRVSTASVDAHALMTDSLLNYETIKCFGAEAGTQERYASASDVLEAEWGRFLGLRGRIGLAAASVFALSMAVSIVVAGRAVADGSLTVGGFVLANLYMLQIVRPLEAMGAAFCDFAHALGFARPLLDVLDEPGEAAPESPNAARLNGAVAVAAAAPSAHHRAAGLSIQDVHFGYRPAHPVLRNLSLEIAAGRSVAIVGESGVGKSSLVRLILRLYEPQAGRILLDEIPVAELPGSYLRGMVGLVPQDTVLFNDTIAYNIGIGKPGASRSEIIEAARMARLEEFIAALPAGYDTVVGERGLKLSGGERQRIAIARAVIKRPRLYVFDEATSSLDSRTEAEILCNLRAISAGCTTLTIAHRLSTVCHADEIVVLDKGQVVERGKHAALLQLGGVYQRLWRAQHAARAAAESSQRTAA